MSLRQMKRQALKKAGLTFTQRVRKAVAAKKPITLVAFGVKDKELVAVERDG